jgi:very-short-patch-repair endonuclease
MARAGFGRSRIQAQERPVKGRARELRVQQTDAEETLWDLLRGRKLLGLKFRRQFPIETYIVDFYCHERHLVVELDGGIHADPRQAAHDENRDAYLRARGLHVLRLRNEAVFEDGPEVLRCIAEAADQSYRRPVPPSPGGREGGGRGGPGG